MIDNKSEEFIKRSINKLRDDKEFLIFIGKVMSQTFDFYMDTPREMLLKLLEDKMRQGAIEHGTVQTNPMNILKEVRNEDLDKLGWNLMLDEAQIGT